jgi:hypothetical protein
MDTTGPPGGFSHGLSGTKKTIMGALFAAIMGRYGDIGISIVSGLSENDGKSIEKLKILC